MTKPALNHTSLKNLIPGCPFDSGVVARKNEIEKRPLRLGEIDPTRAALKREVYALDAILIRDIWNWTQEEMFSRMSWSEVAESIKAVSSDKSALCGLTDGLNALFENGTLEYYKNAVTQPEKMAIISRHRQVMAAYHDIPIALVEEGDPSFFIDYFDIVRKVGTVIEMAYEKKYEKRIPYHTYRAILEGRAYRKFMTDLMQNEGSVAQALLVHVEGKSGDQNEKGRIPLDSSADWDIGMFELSDDDIPHLIFKESEISVIQNMVEEGQDRIRMNCPFLYTDNCVRELFDCVSKILVQVYLPRFMKEEESAHVQ